MCTNTIYSWKKKEENVCIVLLMKTTSIITFGKKSSISEGLPWILIVLFFMSGRINDRTPAGVTLWMNAGILHHRSTSNLSDRRLSMCDSGAAFWIQKKDSLPLFLAQWQIFILAPKATHRAKDTDMEGRKTPQYDLDVH